MIHNYEAQVTQLKACIFARQSIFRLARLLRDLLEQLPESKRDDFLYELMDDLELSAAAHYQEAICSKREAYALMHGEEANWFWFFDQTQSCWDLNYPIGIIEEFKRLCDRLLSQYRQALKLRAAHKAQPRILQILRARLDAKQRRALRLILAQIVPIFLMATAQFKGQLRDFYKHKPSLFSPVVMCDYHTIAPGIAQAFSRAVARYGHALIAGKPDCTEKVFCVVT